MTQRQRQKPSAARTPEMSFTGQKAPGALVGVSVAATHTHHARLRLAKRGVLRPKRKPGAGCGCWQKCQQFRGFWPVDPLRVAGFRCQHIAGWLLAEGVRGSTAYR